MIHYYVAPGLRRFPVLDVRKKYFRAAYEAVEMYTGITKDELHRKTNRREIVTARYLLASLLATQSSISLRTIAECAYGERIKEVKSAHSNVINLLEKHRLLVQTNSVYKKIVNNANNYYDQRTGTGSHEPE